MDTETEMDPNTDAQVKYGVENSKVTLYFIQRSLLRINEKLLPTSLDK